MRRAKISRRKFILDIKASRKASCENFSEKFITCFKTAALFIFESFLLLHSILK